mgnify:CR=1 FL=1
MNIMSDLPILNIAINNDPELYNLYKNKVEQHNHNVINNECPDSGFDLFIPKQHTFNNYNQLDIILCWCFVFFRVIHFFIRLKNQKTINIIPRTLIFIISLIFLTIGWISLLINSFVI